ncbi:MAG: urate hydroxylase PuuD [Pseudomonadales bacterium]|nr:urate hydroxylase PuuD [Pseudomonadales bacterium]
MEAYILEWTNLLLRWLHVITGIAWIGSSFYFVWLDNHLLPPLDKNRALAGEVWSVHGGGFYQARKYRLAPEIMPDPLHWFKWEAYSTWISGFLLLTLVYWYGAETYLIDPSRADLSKTSAVFTGLGGLILGWVIYDLMCRSPLASNDGLLGTGIILLLTTAAYGFCQLFGGRGAFIHFGAMIGTIMVANVFFIIIPGQKKIVSAASKGETPDPTPGIKGKQRSVHNTYLTLPVLFVMISNHYAFTYSGEYNWIVLLGIALLGVLVRAFFISRHKIGHDSPLNQTRESNRRSILLVLIFLVLASIIYSGKPASQQANSSVTASFSDIEPIIKKHCVVCHSSKPTQVGFNTAPLGISFDTQVDIVRQALLIHQQAVVTKAMPIGNLTGISAAERLKIDAWFRSNNAP